MKDAHGRNIDYMRISVTQSCNLRCQYCMPNSAVDSEEYLSYAQILRVCAQATRLGIVDFKITGGEPLLRPDLPDFIHDLKDIPGVRSVTLTTNGILLDRFLEQIQNLDGINISLDAFDPVVYEKITKSNAVSKALAAIRASCEAGISTKINTVLLEENRGEWMKIAALAEELPVSVRFIELMPIGYGRERTPVSVETFLQIAKLRYLDLEQATAHGNGPAKYLRSSLLKGYIGYIAANTHTFCADCNRIRLTSTGQLLACLGSSGRLDLKAMLRNDATDADIRAALEETIRAKPSKHAFDRGNSQKTRMYEIGG